MSLAWLWLLLQVVPGAPALRVSFYMPSEEKDISLIEYLAPTPAAPAGGNNGTIPYNGPTAGASNSHTLSTWVFTLASFLVMAIFGL